MVKRKRATADSSDQGEPSVAAQHQDLVAYVDEKFNYWNRIPYQVAIKREYYRVCYPIATIQAGAPVDFSVLNGSGSFIDLQRSKIETTFKITKANGTDLVTGDSKLVGVVNNIGHSMWTNIEVQVNGKTVTENTNLYPVKALFCHLLNHSPDSLATKGVTTCGYKRDTEPEVNDLKLDANSPNVGFRERSIPFAESKMVTMNIRPYVDIFNTNQYFPDNTTLNIRLYPSSNKFCLMSDGTEFKVAIEGVKFIAYTVEASTGVILAQAKLLAQTHRMSFPFEKIAISQRIIPQGVSNYTMNALYQANLPRRVILMFVNNEHINGQFTSNPFYFHHFNLTDISMKVDGEEYPREGYKMDFIKKDYTDAYNKVLEGLGFDVDNTAIDLTPSVWANGLTFFVFKLSPGPLSGIGAASRVGNSILTMSFSSPTAKTINCIMLSEYESMLEINDQRDVTVL